MGANFEAQMQRMMFWTGVIELIAAAIAIAILYWFTRLAVRHAIEDSGMVDAIKALRTTTLREQLKAPDTQPMPLSEIKAD